MAFQHKPNTGSLFVNDKKESDKHPNVKGSAMIDGVEYWVAAWTNEKDGNRYQSLKFERKDKAQSQTPSQPQGQPQPAPASDDSWDDDIPF